MKSDPKCLSEQLLHVVHQKLTSMWEAVIIQNVDLDWQTHQYSWTATARHTPWVSQKLQVLVGKPQWLDTKLHNRMRSQLSWDYSFTATPSRRQSPVDFIRQNMWSDETRRVSRISCDLTRSGLWGWERWERRWVVEPDNCRWTAAYFSASPLADETWRQNMIWLDNIQVDSVWTSSIGWTNSAWQNM